MTNLGVGHQALRERRPWHAIAARLRRVVLHFLVLGIVGSVASSLLIGGVPGLSNAVLPSAIPALPIALSVGHTIKSLEQSTQ